MQSWQKIKKQLLSHCEKNRLNMYASSFEAQIDVLKIVEASEDYCAPVIFCTNISEHNIFSHHHLPFIEIGRSGEFVDVREMIEALKKIPDNCGQGRSYFYEGMSIRKTTVDHIMLDTKFEGKVVIASIDWGSWFSELGIPEAVVIKYSFYARVRECVLKWNK